MNLVRLLAPIFAAFLFSAAAAGQTLIFRVTTPTETRLVLPAGTTTIFAPAIGTPLNFQVSVSYEGALNGTLTRADFVAAPEYSITAAPALPRGLRAGESIRWDMRFAPSSGARSEAQLAVTLRETESDGTVLGQSVLILTLTGTAPDLVTSALTETENYRRLAGGDKITFPPTPIGSTFTVPIAVTNRGGGPGRLEVATLNSPHFQLVQLPITPAAIEPPGELRFGVRYAPREPGQHTADLRIRTSSENLIVTLEGSPSAGPTSLLRYFRVEGSEAIPLFPSSTINLRDAEVGKRSTMTLRITNTGPEETSSLFVGTDGGAFTLAEGNRALTIQPGASVDLTLAFQPFQLGPAEAALRIGNDSFTLRATGLTSQLTYRYDSISGVITTAPGGRVLLSPTMLGGVLRRSFTIENTGNQTDVISSILLASGQSGIQLEDLPPLPLSLGTGQSASFTLRFSPPAVGVFSDSLAIGPAIFDITATGTRPQALPPYEILSTLSTGEPNQVSELSLRLTQPYALPVTGSVSLRINPNGAGIDPNVQFLAGGRVAAFRIPANSQDAIFENETTRAGFHTGTLTGTLTFVPSFSTSGDTDVTPETPGTTRLFIAPLPPRLLTARITDISAAGFVLVVNGFVTNRRLNSMHVDIKTEENEPGTQLTVDVSAAAQAFFGTPVSEPFGGTFSLSLPFTAPRGAPRLRSVSVSAQNDLGRSEELTAMAP